MEIKKNIFLTKTIEVRPFKCIPKIPSISIPKRKVKEHADKILTKFLDCLEENENNFKNLDLSSKNGTYLEFSSESNYPLKYESLEDRKGGIRLLNVQSDSNGISKATIFIPNKKEKILEKKFKDYGSKLTNKKVPKNNILVASIEDLKLADIYSFWTSNKNEIPKENPKWCEIWLRYDNKNNVLDSYKETENNFISICKDSDINISDNLIKFPERIVKLGFLTGKQLNNLISKCPYIAEIKLAPETNYYFNKLLHKEQVEWKDDLLSRTVYSDNRGFCKSRQVA